MRRGRAFGTGAAARDLKPIPTYAEGNRPPERGCSPFVVSDFCKQVAEIEAGFKEPVMYVGNLAAKRDFTDVRDVVRSYALLVQMGDAGETYNMGSGHAYAIQEILDLIISMSTVEIKVEIDPNKIRPVDVPIIEADITKLNAATGWKPEIPLEQTILETLNYWRGRVLE